MNDFSERRIFFNAGVGEFSLCGRIFLIFLERGTLPSEGTQRKAMNHLHQERYLQSKVLLMQVTLRLLTPCPNSKF